jgi:RNA 2',3'-cyclic 3'-phosphodiesterase
VKRVFIAIKIEPEQTLLRIQASLKSALGGERINWTDTTNIHITIAFLGDTEEEMLKLLSIMVSQKCSEFGKFRLRLKGTGVFKNLRDPRVIWAGIESNERLVKLFEIISTGLKETGFKIEDRSFKPHITLGRIKSLSNPDNLVSAIEKYKEVVIQEVPVNEVIIYESILKPTGPVYKVIGRFSL